MVAVGGWRAGLGQDAPRALDAAGFALILVAALSLGFRRSRPLVPLGVAVGVSSAYLLLGYPFGPILLTVVWAMFEYARRRPLRESAVALAVAAFVSVLAVLPRMAHDLDLLAVGLVLWGACWLAVPWSLGAIVHLRRQVAERERAELVRRVVLEERVRVSREVHDVAGHGFAVVAMQAGVALVVLDEEPGQVREALRAIRDTSRAALEELRAVIENIDSPADVEGLVEQVRAGGVRVELEYDGLAGVSERQRRIAYEVVRESLTNVVKHSPRAGAAVSVRVEGDAVAVEVSNPGAARDGGDEPDGPAQRREHGHELGAPKQGREHGDKLGAPEQGREHGHELGAPEQGRDGGDGRGIGGMRERVESVGGVFEVAVGDGFAVRARIPR
ncbi:sensor histidine kinase [Dactylosporangium sp. CA-052675]|uniref:sensor histidine kinase n=1 Tax=Dactylosporangium sp. CA-052675 TaxID=3239927 RepID=UPI003D933FFA